jgi:DNA-binding transcriptional regulator YiaG
MIRTPDEFRLAREKLGYTQCEFGEMLELGKYPDRSVRRWELGDSRIPRAAAIVLEAMLAGYKPNK